MIRAPLILNEDCNHFVYSRQAEELTPEGIDELVDRYARDTQVSHLAFNVNANRSAVPSKVKQTLWDGFDPKAGDDQPFFKGVTEGLKTYRHWVANMRLLQDRGIDLYARWFARTREYGIKPWLSIRMNDIHVAEDPTSSMHDALWRDNPQYWRAGYREFESERDRGVDYGHAAVRQHYLDYIDEMLGRYDVDALELDWSRQPWVLRPGRETEGAELLNAFTADVRRMTESRGRALRHKIELCARVPSFPETALRMGFDAGAWARAGVVDRLIPTPCFGNTDFDMPIEIWKRMLHGTNVKLAAGLECMMSGMPFVALQFLTIEAARGAAATLLDRGADEIYLYNFMDRDTSFGAGTFDQIVRQLGSLQTLAGKARRHVLTFPNIWPQGGAPPFILPYRLTHYGFRPSAEFRIPIGPAPRSGEDVMVGLGLSPADRPETEGRVIQAHGRKFHFELPPAPNEAAKQLVVRASGELCSYAGPAADQNPDRPGPTHRWRVPEDALHRGDALIEVFNPAEEPLSATWVEISIGK